MATSKELTAKVKLDIGDAESKLRRLTTLINSINRSVASATKVDNGMTKQIAQYDRLALAQQRLAIQKQRADTAEQARQDKLRIAEENLAYKKQQSAEREINANLRKMAAIRRSHDQEMKQLAAKEAKQREIEYQQIKINLAWRKAHPLLTKLGRQLGVNRGKTMEWGTSVEKLVTTLNGKLKSNHSILGGVWQRLKGIAATYLGIMGARAVVDTTDLLVGAQNRLNYVTANQLGSAGYNEGGGYSEATINTTQDAMDKMYVSAQKVRTSYQDMMQNVSKTMSLAGDAFDNNIDHAIRFQEIMAEAYAVGGASAQEMSSSMYQLTQALGSGVLQGDELRSLREGAPLAYQAIEKFAQGVHNTTDSLKDMASEGKITSEMVVAAIMSAGNQLDTAFAQTKQTFGQTWDQIKNTALYAFQPVMEKITEVLQSLIDNGLVQKAEKLFTNVAKVLLIAFEQIDRAADWLGENWLKVVNAVAAGLILWASLITAKAAISVWAAYQEIKAWMIANGVTWATIAGLLTILGTIMIIVAAVLGLIYVFILWKQGAINTCQAIVAALAIVGVAVLLLGLIFGIIPVIVIGVVLIILALLFHFFEEVCGIGWGILTFIGNLIQSILNIIVAVIATIIAICINAVILMMNVLDGLGSVIGAVCSNIGIAFTNAWNGAKAAFWDFVADCLDGLKDIEVPINAIAQALGAEGFELSDLTDNVRGKADAARDKMQDYVDVGDAWKRGFSTTEYLDIEAINDSAMATFGTGLADWSWEDSVNQGEAWGAGVEDSINNWGSKFQKNRDQTKKASVLDNIGKELGLDFSGMGNFPTDGVGSAYSPDYDKLLGDVGNIDDNTGSIADSMELSEEDLKYLRLIAEREWKKEFTTANIKVEMTNNNNVDKDFDLNSLAIGLRGLVEEEMFAVANGVYA